MHNERYGYHCIITHSIQIEQLLLKSKNTSSPWDISESCLFQSENNKNVRCLFPLFIPFVYWRHVCNYTI